MSKTLHTPEYEHFRLLITTAREKSGLTQADVAAKMGRPQSFVSKYESGERRLDVVEFIHVCEALKVDPQALIYEVKAEMYK
jgi:transcriptional regulator with XRE-family HTH domain